VCAVTLLHLPLLLAAALLGHQRTTALTGLLVALALVAAAAGPFRRRPRALAATAALLTCSVTVARLFPDHPEVHAHLLVVVAVIALYEDTAVFGLAVLAPAVDGVLGRLLGQGDHAPALWPALWWATGWTACVLAEAAVLALFWRADEQARAGEERLQAALWEGQANVRARLEETERIRTDLIGTVSHEFRTPLTGIRGAALTLLKRGDRLDEASRTLLLQGVLEQQERLSRLLENMLTAARATGADPAAFAEVDAVAAEVAMLAGAARPQSPTVSVVVEPGTLARIDRHALHQVLANLVDNAQLHGAAGAVPLVAGGRDDDVWVAVSNEGGPLDPAATRHLFEPFTQGESGLTREHEGLGMGLYVVRRLVEVYGGTVTVRAEEGWVTVEVRLAVADRPQDPTALPIPYVTAAAAAPSKS
jgi:signal transduction histidine kinase